MGRRRKKYGGGEVLSLEREKERTCADKRDDAMKGNSVNGI